MDRDCIRIASGQGFWGDLPSAPANQVRKGEIDYLVMDYLAEVTMSIMQKQRMKNPDYGYARDIIDVLDDILPDIAANNIKVVTNAGGVNPKACKNEILKCIDKHQLSGLRVAVVDGDDILDKLDDLLANGHKLANMETGKPITNVKEQLLSANVYFGCQPIVEALEKGANIVITGRVTDTGLTLGPMAHEFGWNFDDYNKMAAGTIAGHINECGGQASGGNFTDWQRVERFSDIGFPVIEAYSNGEFFVTKHSGTGGLVNEMTVKEQLLYEIGDPKEYITPDCVADFSSIKLKQSGENRVRVYNIKGQPETETYKISASYYDGYKLSTSLVYSWPDALEKAIKGGQILQQRADDLNLAIDEFNTEYVGVNGVSEQPITKDIKQQEFNEVEMRISVMGRDRDAINRFGKEIAPLILTGPSGVTGFAGGRPKASQIVAYWPALLSKDAIRPQVSLYHV